MGRKVKMTAQQLKEVKASRDGMLKDGFTVGAKKATELIKSAVVVPDEETK